MPANFVFEPGPRSAHTLKREKIALVRPSPPPPTVSLREKLLWVVLGTTAGLVLGGVLLVKQIYWAAIPVILFFCGLPIIHLAYWYTSSKKRRDAALVKYRAAYQAEVERLEGQLEDLGLRQRKVRLADGPDYATCMTRVARLEPVLWNRHPVDRDFLALRAGVGREPVEADVSLPASGESGDEADDLVRMARLRLDPHLEVAGVPISLPLRDCKVAGIVGIRGDAIRALGALVTQIGTHHSPRDVRVAAVYSVPEEGDWLRWLPHCWSVDRKFRFLARDPAEAARLVETLEGAAAGPDAPHFVVLVFDRDLLPDGGAQLAGLCLSSKIRAIFVEAHERDLPRETGGVLYVRGPESTVSIRRGDSSSSLSLVPDLIPPADAERFARAVAPMRAPGVAGSEIPEEAGLFQALRIPRAEELNVSDAWRQPPRGSLLPLSFGLGLGGEVCEADLATSGHLLVAGLDGTARRGLLRSVMLGLALRHPPGRLAFAGLDPSANQLMGDLSIPHLLAHETSLAITGGQWKGRRDVPPAYSIRRCVLGLTAEMARREEKLASQPASVSSVTRGPGSGPDALPFLVVVVEDVGWVRRSSPDLAAVLAGLVRRGPELGIHLLAAGANGDEDFGRELLEAPSLRVSFPLQSASEVQRFVGGNREISGPPGRALLRLPQDVAAFQAADASAPVQAGGAGPDDSIREVHLDGRRERLTPGTASGGEGETQGQFLARRLSEAQDLSQAPLPAPPWLPPLLESLYVDEMQPAGWGWDGRSWRPIPTWMVSSAGLVEAPEQQARFLFQWHLESAGNIAVYGPKDSGCSTALVSSILGLAWAHSPLELYAYLVDFGGGSLAHLEDLPHVGATLVPEQAWLLDRLLRFLHRHMAARRDRLAGAGFRSVDQYRASTGETWPAIVLAVDELDRVLERHPEVSDLVISLAQEGPPLGVHLAFTAEQPSRMGLRLNSAVRSAVALGSLDPAELAGAVGPVGDLEPLQKPGRGVVRGTPPWEVQVALPARGTGDFERNTALKALVDTMNRAWEGARPPGIPVLPDVVTLGDLFHPDDLHWSFEGDLNLTVPVGLDSLEVERVYLDVRQMPILVVTGPPGGGKTTFLRTLLLSLAGHVPPQRLRMALIDLEGTSLRLLETLPHASRFVSDATQLSDLLRDLQGHQQRWKLRDSGGMAPAAEGDEVPWLLVVDDLPTLQRLAPVMDWTRFQELIRMAGHGGLHIVVAANSADLATNSFDPTIKALLQPRTGVVVGATDHQGVFGHLKIPELGSPRPGDSIHVWSGQVSSRFRAATPDKGAISLIEWIDAITWMTAREVDGVSSGGGA